MPQKKSKIPQFWQELKRRRVVHVIAVYASVAWLLIQLVNNLLVPLNLPTVVSTIVIIALAVGFPLTIILAWMYDLKPDVIVKTREAGGEGEDDSEDDLKDDEQEELKVVTPLPWRIATYASFVVIAGLLTINLAGRSKHLRAGDIQSLVILPFDNFTGDDELEYFVSGMHASLIGDMGQVGGLQVKSRTSSSAIKEMGMTIPEIATELGADAALETAVMCLGDTICIQLRLVRTTGDEEQLWVADYREEKSQVLNLYNRITKQIAEEVMVELSEDEKRRLDKTQTVDVESYDAYLRSYALWQDFSKESLDQAFDYLSQAIQKSPDWAPLYIGMAQIWGIRVQMGLVEPSLGYKMQQEYSSIARELDPGLPEAYFLNGISSTWADWDWEKGERAFLKAIAMNPSDAMPRIYYAHLLSILQRFDEALVQGELAVELDPFNPLILSLYSVVLISAGQYQEALEYAGKGLAIYPQHSFSITMYKEALLALGEYDRAFEYRKKVFTRFFPEERIEYFDQVFQEQGYFAAEKEIVREFELLAQEKYVTNYVLAVRHCSNGEYSKALDDLESGYEEHEPNMPYIASGYNGMIDLYDSTRFIAIVKKMNLPLPKQSNHASETK